ncbi:unnamed protein product [Prorocentrum cordatum]|uniref:Uncharacterized protein n=1 Tax=Prorocentrum cordatum TaxID=2364126 RepID=A0ABN9Y459_9DINO|nr:unnamed protein product [Polarella glacialis]
MRAGASSALLLLISKYVFPFSVIWTLATTSAARGAPSRPARVLRSALGASSARRRTPASRSCQGHVFDVVPSRVDCLLSAGRGALPAGRRREAVALGALGPDRSGCVFGAGSVLLLHADVAAAYVIWQGICHLDADHAVGRFQKTAHHGPAGPSHTTPSRTATTTRRTYKAWDVEVAAAALPAAMPAEGSPTVGAEAGEAASPAADLLGAAWQPHSAAAAPEAARRGEARGRAAAGSSAVRGRSEHPEGRGAAPVGGAGGGRCGRNGLGKGRQQLFRRRQLVAGICEPRCCKALR